MDIFKASMSKIVISVFVHPLKNNDVLGLFKFNAFVLLYGVCGFTQINKNVYTYNQEETMPEK